MSKVKKYPMEFCGFVRVKAKFQKCRWIQVRNIQRNKQFFIFILFQCRKEHGFSNLRLRREEISILNIN